jgi:6-phosphogluconolactonase
LKRIALSLLLASAFAAPAAAETYIVYVGSYTDGANAGKGIYAARFDTKSGALTPIGQVATTINPAFLTGSKDGRFLYAVNWQTPAVAEKKPDTVTAYSVDRKTGALTQLNQVSAGGALPNEALVDPSGKVLITANYGSGVRDGHNAGLSAMQILPDGKLADPFYVDIHPNEPIATPPTPRAGGRGGDPLANFGAHTHGIAFSKDNKYVFIADLGLDRVYTYTFDAAKPALAEANPAFVHVSPNAGPRRLVVSPDGKFLYCNHQDDGKVSVFQIGAGGALKEVQQIGTQPDDYTGRASTAEIVIDKAGKFLYVSNRGNDTIAVYTIDPASGLLKRIENVGSVGKSPRNMTLDPTGNFIFVANQSSGDLQVFKMDNKTGHLTPTGATMAVPQAAGVFVVKP